MKVTCPISGISYRASSFFEGPNEWVVRSLHPIFSLTSEQLLARARKYKQGIYSETELRLLFLAVLNKTSLVTFEVPAEPSQNCVLRNLDSAYKIMIWVEKVINTTVRLPTYVVTKHNSDMNNINHFFDALYEARSNWEAPNFKRITEDLLASREMLLWKQLHSGKKTPSFYKRLAYWTLDCIGIHAANQPDKREEWARILQITEPAELFMIDKEEFFDMYGYIHREITMPGSIGMGSGYTYSQEVLKHINWMKHILDLGPTGYMMEQIGGPSNSYEIKSDTSSEPELEEELLLLEKQIIEEDVPTVEPKRADYPLSMDWLRARAKWTRTQTIRDKLYIVRATLEARKKTEEIKKRENDTNQQTIIRLRSLMNLGTAS